MEANDQFPDAPYGKVISKEISKHNDAKGQGAVRRVQGMSYRKALEVSS